MGSTNPSSGKRKNLAVVIWGSGLLIGIPLVILHQGLSPGGFLTTSDVGDVAELDRFQKALMPLDACHITYGRRGKFSRRTNPDAVFLEPCIDGSNTVVIKVPAHHDVGFEMKRKRRTDRFQIIVEKSNVPFPELVATLDDYTPRITQSFDKTLQDVRTMAEDTKRHEAEQRRLQEERKAKAKDSYPSK